MQSEIVVVGLCTCRRPKMLQACLDSLATQILPEDCLVHIVVVDNEEQPNARPIVERFALYCPIPVHYVHEPRRGIATARNASVDKAVALGADWIAVLDDDETAERNWIAELMSPKFRDVPVLAGQRNFVYTSEPSFWEKPRREKPSGEMNNASTCNVRFSTALIDAGLRFDESFNLMGGEDRHFFAQAYAAGFRIERNTRAITYETSHPERTTFFGIIQRHYRQQAYIALEDMQKNGGNTLLRQFPAVVFNAFAGLALLTATPLSIIGGKKVYRETALRSGKHIANAFAPIAVLTGHKPSPYRHVVGS
jgi:succinoglycan biosynthesis protein ExoM